MNLQIFSVIVTLWHSAFSLNFRNNVCSKLSDYPFAPFRPSCRYNPDVLSDIAGMAKNNGFILETHTLTTSSGYILNFYRLKSEKIEATGYSILFLHGIAADTGSWINTGNRSYVYKLVEAGYDIWLLALRGSADSNKHTTLNINDPAYWTFSLDDLVNEDLDMQITYIYGNTKEKLLIVGHSMGTTLSFMYVSEFFEKANQVLRGVVALAPVVYLTGTPAYKNRGPIGNLLLNILDALRIRGLLYQGKIIHPFIVSVCRILPKMCYLFLSRIGGKTEQMLPEDLPVIFSYWPSGMSVRQLKHFNQIEHSGNFQKYDFGTESENKKHYNTSKPPLYNLTNALVPACIFFGRNDVFYTQENIDRLVNELGTDRKYVTPTPTNVPENLEFSHLDFLTSKNVIEYLYEPLLEKLQTFFN